MTNNIYDQWQSLTGLEFLQAMIASDDASPMGHILNQRVIEAGDGYAVVQGVPEEKFYNTMRRVHGGFAATLLDTALGCAVMSKLGKAVGYGTIELKVNYVRKIEVASGPLNCRANVLHAGRTMLTAEAKVADAKGVLYAHGSGTFLVYPK
jgi:uncharacterized protein (TIGR00369 family)